MRPITFDSFATRLLATLPDADVPANWRDLGFDGRIAAAAEALGSDEGRAAASGYRHILVDEIQDLVGVRASLVEGLIREANGFTLLGDPAQAIYDHQVRATPDATSSGSFLRAVREFHPELQTVRLEDNYRTRGRQAGDVEGVGALLRLPEPDKSEVQTRLADVLRDLDQVESFDELAGALRGTEQRAAVLCRTNDKALAISRRLADAGIENRLQRQATERVLPAWLAHLFRDVQRTVWGQNRLASLVEERLDGYPDAPGTDAVWQLLTGLVSDDQRVDLQVVRDRIRQGQVPDEFSQNGGHSIVVSTIHRSKGLEFDVVFLTAPVATSRTKKSWRSCVCSTSVSAAPATTYGC